ncbi:MAG: class I SAM-dependent rRNA methyltransferase [Simkaniaceae bacterium]|nr:class I SAM-dependent rRNA methyltransferase [Simkaniaceae bacterium]
MEQNVILKRGKEVIFRNRHLWIFSGAIESYPKGYQEGAIYPVCSSKGDLLGHAYFHSKQSLAGRIVSFGDEDPWQGICRHLDQAINLRKALFHPQETNAFRLVNGEGDHLPGLVIDQYGEYLVLQSGTLGIDLLKEKIVTYLMEKGVWKGVFEKSSSGSRKEEGLQDQIKVLAGTPCENIEIIENGVRFRVNWEKGQKTGFFLDQREMRLLVKKMSRGRKVLNCFSYTGGFSIYALQGGAAAVDSLDISAAALAMGKEHLHMNGGTDVPVQWIEQDAFDFLRNDSLNYDLVILDPPAFVKKKRDLAQGIRGYREINHQAMSKMPRGSFLLTCSCSYYLDEAEFRTLLFQAAEKAEREVQVIHESFHAPDHPLNLFHPEGRYLKSFLLYLT